MIEIEKILPAENVLIDVKCQSKEEAIDCLINLIKKNTSISDEEKLRKEIWEREHLSYTGIGNHIALAHAESETVNSIITSCIRLKDYVDWAPKESYPLPYKMIKFIFLFVVPKGECKGTELLKSMVLKLGNKESIQKLMDAGDSMKLIQIFM